MSAKRTRVDLGYSANDVDTRLSDVGHAWVSVDGVEKLQQIWLDASPLMQANPGLSVSIEAWDYVEFSEESGIEKKTTEIIEIKIYISGECTLTISDKRLSIFGDFKL